MDTNASDALPHLAEQYHVTGNEGWLQAVTEEEKRNLIKSSIKMHRYKGTKYAIKEIFKTLNLIGDVEEWFEYNGEPYHFKVSLKISDTSISENMEERLLASVKEYKNERSLLETLNFLLISKGKYYTYSALAEEQIIYIFIIHGTNTLTRKLKHWNTISEYCVRVCQLKFR